MHDRTHEPCKRGPEFDVDRALHVCIGEGPPVSSEDHAGTAVASAALLHAAAGLSQRQTSGVNGGPITNLIDGGRCEETKDHRLRGTTSPEPLATRRAKSAGVRAGTWRSPDRTRFFFSSRRRHTRLTCDWSSDVCSSDLLDPSNVMKSRLMERLMQLRSCAPELSPTIQFFCLSQGEV